MEVELMHRSTRPPSRRLVSHSSSAIVYKVNEETGELRIASLEIFSKSGDRRWSLPGGARSGMETPLQTVRRETRQELSAYSSQEYFLIEFDEKPVVVIRSERDDRKGEHRKFFFLAHEMHGDLRQEEKEEPDGDILGIPTFIELSRLVEIFRRQRKKSRHQLEGLLAGLKRLCENPDDELARRVSQRYWNLIPQ